MNRNLRTRQIQMAGRTLIQRLLPPGGEIVIRRGQEVTPATPIGHAPLVGRFVMVDVAAALRTTHLDWRQVLQKQEGEPVTEGEELAVLKGRLPFGRRVCRAPVSGQLVARLERHLLIETDMKMTPVPALVHGVVMAVVHPRRVSIEVTGTIIEGACALGEDAVGVLKVISDDPAASLEPEMFDLLDRQAIFVAGGSVSEAAIRRAEELGLSGLVVGSFDAALLDMTPPPRIPVLATEGFGNIPMRRQTFEMLQARDGIEASLLVSARDAAFRGGGYPILLVSGLPKGYEEPLPPPNGKVTAGSLVRILKGPAAFQHGKVVALPDTPRSTEAGLACTGAEVFTGESTHFLPWPNLEHIG